MILRSKISIALAVLTGLAVLPALSAVDLGEVTEKHVMVPMRDGVKLSMYSVHAARQGTLACPISSSCT